MTITTTRVSGTEVQVDRTLYKFAQKADANSFQRCLVDTSIDSCYRSHPPVSARAAMPGEPPNDPGRGSMFRGRLPGNDKSSGLFSAR